MNEENKPEMIEAAPCISLLWYRKAEGFLRTMDLIISSKGLL